MRTEYSERRSSDAAAFNDIVNSQYKIRSDNPVGVS